MSDYVPVFIYDRNQNDIDNKTEKGFINAADLDRIDTNTELIAGDIAVTVSVKKDWTTGGFPRASDYERIKENTQKIRGGYAVYSDTPQVPDRPFNTFRKWNDIERILYDVFTLFVKNKEFKTYCGEDFSCGDEIGVI